MDATGALTILIALLVLGLAPFALAAVVLAIFHRGELDRPERFRDPSRRTGNTVTLVAGVVTGALLWAVWISWGNFEYPTWAIVGCVVSSVVAVIGLGFLSRWRWTGPFVAAFGGLFGFSTTCGAQMAFSDDTGLWGVGYMMIVGGGGVVLALIATGVMLVRMPALPRRTSSAPPGTRPGP